jgi:hypothetical protein
LTERKLHVDSGKLPIYTSMQESIDIVATEASPGPEAGLRSARRNNMPSVPPENIGDMLRLYQDQLELKDAHIAALTNLLKEANARLAQQQRISEGMLAAQSGAAKGVSTPGDRPSPHSEAPEVAATAVVDQRLNESGTSPYDHAVTSDYSSNHGKELAFASVSAPAEHEYVEHQEENAQSSALRPLTFEDAGGAASAAPIPMSYFGPPIANLAANLKEATAESDPVALSEIREPDDEKYIALRKKLTEARSSADQNAPLRQWYAPALAVSVVVVAGAAFFVPWKNMVGQSHTSPPRMSRALPSLEPAQPQHNSGLPALPHASERLPGAVAVPKPSDGAALAGPQSNPAPAATGSQSAEQTSKLDAQLVEAVARANVKRVRQLLSKGADVNARNGNQSTVLAMAASRGSEEIVDVLLSEGADVNASNDRGWTALMLAVNSKNKLNKRKSIVDTLLKHGAHADAVNSQGTTALMMAAQVGEEAIVRRLLAARASVLVKNSSGRTAQDMALLKNNTEVAAILAEAGATQP